MLLMGWNRLPKDSMFEIKEAVAGSRGASALAFGIDCAFRQQQAFINEEL
jgi:hypothetical protein